MADPTPIPPSVLEFFRALRTLTDQTIAQLELAQSQPGRVIERVLTDSAGASDSLNVTVRPGPVDAVAHVLPPTLTVERFEEARLWTELAAAAQGALPPVLATAEALAVLESLLQLAQRLLNVG